ncbi:MAG: type II toxin-antitoxin system HigB family toxin [Acidobacteriota bacterium]
MSERKLREFWESSNGAERQRREKVFKLWRGLVRKADWSTFADVRTTFNHSDVYGNCTIFDVGENRYRVAAKVEYRIKVVFIRAMLTHTDYDSDQWKGDCE